MITKKYDVIMLDGEVLITIDASSNSEARNKLNKALSIRLRECDKNE